MDRSRSFKGWGVRNWRQEIPLRRRKVARSSLGNMLMTDLLANTFVYFLVEEIYL